MLQHVLPVPSVAAETDRIERQICPKLILRLVHPIVAKGAFSGEGRRKKEEGRRTKDEVRRVEIGMYMCYRGKGDRGQGTGNRGQGTGEMGKWGNEGGKGERGSHAPIEEEGETCKPI